MKKEEIEPKLAGLMDTVPECEGLIYAKADGSVIIGQTITQMNHGSIAKSLVPLIKTDISKSSGKGPVREITINLEKGFVIVLLKDDFMLIGMLGIDGKNSIGLLSRQLKLVLG